MQLDRARLFTLRMAIGAPTHLPLIRCEVVDQLEALISLLDLLNGDPDFEDGAEPSLGWTKTMAIGDWRDLEECVVI